ncbi:hypothetical protein HPP92_026020 [Vanilla planifolia]|uniref:Uncharacterized protein n=1 Tax=Vanilla planifolia TaxID=51239 RepID=A0A835PHS1_VANPL|nr:hypothetical protein HPP92_026297 [Vanilla planifolia]KAG0451762.1 hypothetical protein HPP92_026020 [Vanilla planifolia]
MKETAILANPGPAVSKATEKNVEVRARQWATVVIDMAPARPRGMSRGGFLVFCHRGDGVEADVGERGRAEENIPLAPWGEGFPCIGGVSVRRPVTMMKERNEDMWTMVMTELK